MEKVKPFNLFNKHIEFISEPFEMNTARGISMEEDLNNKDPPKNQ